MRAVIAIAGTELRRFARDRSNIFFVLIFPLLLVLVLGLQFGGGGGSGSVTISGAQGQLQRDLADELTAADLEVREADQEQMRTMVARGRTQVGLYVPAAAEESYADGGEAQVEMIVASGGTAPATAQRVRTVLQAVSLEQTQQAVLVDQGLDAGEASAALDAARSSVDPIELRVQNIDQVAQEFAGLGQFDLSAATMLLLFVFLSTLSSAVMLIQSRRLGIQRRVLAAPLSSPQALLGQLAGRWVIAVVQGGYIMLASIWLFDVDFGTTWLALLIIAVFAAVATGAAMLLGALMDHEGAASGVSVGLGLVLGALGGCMFPLEFFPDTLYTVAHITPHAWGYEAFAQIQRHGGGLADIGAGLAVLAGMALVLVVLGSLALRRSVARAM